MSNHVNFNKLTPDVLDDHSWLHNFVEESNRIEGMHDVLTTEIDAHKLFLEQPTVTVGAIQNFVHAVEPGALLRSGIGMDVVVGLHVPIPGGWEVESRLKYILLDLMDHTPYANHIRYEDLHPFTDGNGRSGRALWLWQHLNRSMGINNHLAKALGFLHAFYYESLHASRRAQP